MLLSSSEQFSHPSPGLYVLNFIMGGNRKFQFAKFKLKNNAFVKINKVKKQGQRFVKIDL